MVKASREFQIFTHCRPYVAQLAALRGAGQPPERLMQLIQDADLKARPKVGRNDPCPCGSGRKHKQCCLRAGKDVSAP